MSIAERIAAKSARNTWQLDLLPISRVCINVDPAYARQCAVRTEAYARRRGDRTLAVQSRMFVLLASRALGEWNEALMSELRSIVDSRHLPIADRAQLVVRIAAWG
jgi:hypothetical protein